MVKIMWFGLKLQGHLKEKPTNDPILDIFGILPQISKIFLVLDREKNFFFIMDFSLASLDLESFSGSKKIVWCAKPSVPFSPTKKRFSTSHFGLL